MDSKCDACGKPEVAFRYAHVMLCAECEKKFGPSRNIHGWEPTEDDKTFLKSLRISPEA